ncbi:11726_t:CDS:2, partial [Gigaspora margarita]
FLKERLLKKVYCSTGDGTFMFRLTAINKNLMYGVTPFTDNIKPPSENLPPPDLPFHTDLPARFSKMITINHALEIASEISKSPCNVDNISERFKLLFRSTGKFDKDDFFSKCKNQEKTSGCGPSFGLYDLSMSKHDKEGRTWMCREGFYEMQIRPIPGSFKIKECTFELSKKFPNMNTLIPNPSPFHIDTFESKKAVKLENGLLRFEMQTTLSQITPSRVTVIIYDDRTTVTSLCRRSRCKNLAELNVRDDENYLL